MDWETLAFANQGFGIVDRYTPALTNRGVIEWMADGTVSRGVPSITVRRALGIAALENYDVVATINFLDELAPVDGVPT